MDKRLLSAWLLSFAAIGSLLAAPPALAQPAPIKPGLWEMQIQNEELDAARAQMDKQFAQMPPAMRKQMEQMMASRGIAMSGGGAIKACVTPEQARRGPTMNEKGCNQNIEWSGKVGKYRMQCDDGREGHGEVTYVSDKQWTAWGEFTDPSRAGKAMKFRNSGRWLGEDCGTLAPMPQG